MNITKRPGALLKSAIATVFPVVVSGSENGGALVPSGNIVEGVRAMMDLLNGSRKLGPVELR
jgi:hypothetical protein